MDGLLALTLWDLVIEVLRSTKDNIQPKHTTHQETGAVLDSKPKTQHVTREQKVEQLREVDYVPTNTRSSQGESQLYIFEDNEAVIIMMIKGRSPTMRHVLRTPRVALDWFFDRINLEPKIQIKYVDMWKIHLVFVPHQSVFSLPSISVSTLAQDVLRRARCRKDLNMTPKTNLLTF